MNRFSCSDGITQQRGKDNREAQPGFHQLNVISPFAIGLYDNLPGWILMIQGAKQLFLLLNISDPLLHLLSKVHIVVQTLFHPCYSHKPNDEQMECCLASYRELVQLV